MIAPEFRTGCFQVELSNLKGSSPIYHALKTGAVSYGETGVTALHITFEASIAHMRPEFTIWHRPAQPRVKLPQPVWPGQSFAALAKGFDRYSATPSQDFAQLSDLQFHLFALPGAAFVIGNGVDGLIVRQDSNKIAEPACFTDSSVSKLGLDLTSLGLPIRYLDDIFVGFDGAWQNYFHFLCYSLARCNTVNPYLPQSCQIVIPRFEQRPGGFEMAYQESTYRQAIQLSGLAERLTQLPMGVYVCKTLRFMWSLPRQPTEFLDMPPFYHFFAQMRAKLRYQPEAPRRLLLSRANARDPRIGAEAAELVQAICLARGFTVVHFEDMDFLAQAEALYNADCIVAPHGAGLVNTLFGRDELKVLELATELDGDGSVRACFYQICANRGQPYMILNGSQGEINVERLTQALDFLCCR